MPPSAGRRTLLLTGAFGRLGVAVRAAAARENLDVICVSHKARLTEGQVDHVDLSSGDRAHTALRIARCDLTSAQDIEALVSTLTGLGHNIDYLMHAAGDLRFHGPLTDALWLDAEARPPFSLHVFASALLGSALLHYQWKNVPVASQDAAILNISSISGLTPHLGTGQGYYAASKSAQNMLTLHMAHDFAPYGVRVNALAPTTFPGLVATERVAEVALRVLLSSVTGKVVQVEPEQRPGA